MYINKAIVFGNLTRDPEIKALPSGIKVTSFSLATNRTWKDKNGAKQDAVDYHYIVAFGRQAEVIAQYMKKGSSILVEGRMQTRSWEDKGSGEKKYRTEIVADAVQFGPKVGGGGSPASKGDAPGGSDKDIPAPAAIDYPEEEINPDDIPF